MPNLPNLPAEPYCRTSRHAARVLGWCAVLLTMGHGFLDHPALAGDGPPASESPAAAAGFSIELVAGDPATRFPMFGALDDRGRLYVAESSGLDLYAELSAQTRHCRVRLLDDADGDGRFESSQIFADKLVFPMGLVWRDGSLYVADPPELIRLSDTDGDQRADKREVVLSGFGHRDNGSLHGLTFGPDGLLYMTMGSPDGYRLTLRDGREVTGESGALIRCRPDGTDPEVLARGFENLVEVVFLETGETIGSDNWFQRPTAGMRDALVHLLPGGLYPLHPDVGTPQPLTGVELPPISLYPAVALSGLELYRGASFPDMQGHLFSAQHNSRRVTRHVLAREKASFRCDDFPFVTSEDPDFHPSDVLEDADGSLLVIDTGGWYVQHCPTGRIRPSQAPGGIYRVRYESAAPVRDPWGKAIPWAELTPTQLAELMSDHRPRVRDRAGRALTALGAAAIPELSRVLATGSEVAQVAATWSLAGIPDDAALNPLRAALDQKGSSQLTVTARALATRRDSRAAPQLVRLLEHTDLLVRLAAAEAMANCGAAEHVDTIVRALSQAREPQLVHSLALALYQCANRRQLTELTRPETPAPVRATALRLIDQAPHSAADASLALAALADDSPLVRDAAMFLLRRHPEWAPQLTQTLRDMFQEPASDAGADVAAELTAAMANNPEVARIAALALTGKLGPVDDRRRVRLLESLAASDRSELAEPLTVALAELLSESDELVLLGAIRLAGRTTTEEIAARLESLAYDTGRSAPLRLAALQTVVGHRPEVAEATRGFLLEQLSPDAAPADRLAAAAVLVRGQVAAPTLIEVLNRVHGDPLVSADVLLPLLVRTAVADVAGPIFGYLEHAAATGWRPHSLAFQPLRARLHEADPRRLVALEELWERQTAALRERLAELEPLLQSGDPGRGREVFLGKKANCSACHRVAGVGGQVGPDLSHIATARSGRDLIESIAAPGSTFAQGYENYIVTTADGQVLTGILARQDAASIFLKDAAGTQRMLPRTEIEEIQRSPASVMPEGLDRTLTRDELRDLLAFLLSQR